MTILLKGGRCNWFSLGELGELCQGVLLQRYLSQPGAPGSQLLPVVHPRDLDFLMLEQSGLSSEYLLPSDSPAFSLQQNDILISVKGASQKAAVITASAVGAVATNNMALLRLHRGLKYPVSPLYLAGLLRSEAFQEELGRLYRISSNTRSLSLKQLRKLLIPLPTLEFQTVFADAFFHLERFMLTAQSVLGARQTLVEHSLQQLLQQPGHPGTPNDH